MTKIEQLREMGQRGNFYVGTYSPGDGVTRYRFTSGTDSINYFAMSSFYTALGFREASAYAEGRLAGYWDAKEVCNNEILEG